MEDSIYKEVNSTLVIIPHYNRLDLLTKCIAYLDESDSSDFDVLIVDNGSSDGSVEYISNLVDTRSNYHMILFSDNLGFAKAANRGMEYSMEHGFKYSLLLNNDVFVEKEFVSKLSAAIEYRPNLFAVSSLMLNASDSDYIDDFGDNYCILGLAFQNKTANKALSITKDENVFGACGGASIYANEKLKKVGLLDEKFFAYLEDVDLSYRAKIMGLNVQTCYAARCSHIGSATSGARYTDFKVKLSARNNIYLVWKNMPILQILINFLPLLVGTLVKYIYFSRKGFGKAYLDGVVEGIKTCRGLNRSHLKWYKIFTYIKIEWLLIVNTFKYLVDYGNRKL